VVSEEPQEVVVSVEAAVVVLVVAVEVAEEASIEDHLKLLSQLLLMLPLLRA
jgi:hypothetical protein